MERVKCDVEQLNTIVNNCPGVCSPTNNIGDQVNRFCGSWYCVINRNERKYVQACQAKYLFGKNQSKSMTTFKDGMTKGDFDDKFASCKIGGRRNIIDVEAYSKKKINKDRLLFVVNQRSRN